MGLSIVTYTVRMSRWEPDARERLVRAALDLFDEQGYSAVSYTHLDVYKRQSLLRRDH